jgi:CBS domain-containing protein
MDLLRKYKVDEHFPAPGMEHLVTIGGDTPISDALKLMIGRNILSVPVLSSTDQGLFYLSDRRIDAKLYEDIF